jgi:hypothetical protein
MLSSCGDGKYGNLEKADIAIFSNASKLMINSFIQGAQSGKTIVKLYDLKPDTTCDSLGYTKKDERKFISEKILSYKSVGVKFTNNIKNDAIFECSYFEANKASPYRGKLFKLMTVIDK